jgi:hypothetical protein
MLKRSLALGPAVVVLFLGLAIGPKYDRYVLPAFDGHVYAAMAEQPRLFTVAPWGYRILEPWLVFLIPASSAALGFFWLNLILLAGAIFTTGWWLRRLGFSDVAASLASFAFAVSPPVVLLLKYQVLVDPLAVLFLVLIYAELERRDLPSLMALLAAAALTKETGLMAVALLPLHLAARGRILRGLMDAVAVAAPALALSVLIRVSWGSPEPPPSSFSILDLTLGRIIASGWTLAGTVVLSGLSLVAAIGLWREPSIRLRTQGLLMWMFTFGLIVANPYHYSVSDLPRLSVFAWPALLPLALSGVGFKRSPAPEAPSRRPGLRTAAAVLTLLLCLGLVAATDPYERAPFPHTPDPVALVGRIRESAKTARALDQGEVFEFDPRSPRYAEPITERFNLTEGRRQRWFLHEGFGRDAVFESGVPEFGGEARLLLPLLVPRNVRMNIEIAGRTGAPLSVSVAGRPIVVIQAGVPASIVIPEGALIRGDNLILFQGGTGERFRLLRFDARLEGAAPLD